ncbi:unnamed protein product [Urochloa humidicola]
MVPSRRLQNLIVESPYIGAKWLRSVDLTSHLFGVGGVATPPSTTVGDDRSDHAEPCDRKKEQAAAAAELKKMRLSNPIFRFQATPAASTKRLDLHVFPLPDREVVIADQTGRTFHCDADTRHLATMPNLHKPKLRAISLFVPSAGGGGSLYVMESIPNPEKAGSVEPSKQFEVFVRSNLTSSGDAWHCRLFLPPPFLRSPTLTYQKITSYAVVGSNIWISNLSNGRHGAGTYCLDTTSNTWNEEAGKWALPFCGKAEYVPELKLWFGLSVETGNLVAADLSAMDSQLPLQVVSFGKEFDPPEEWLQWRDPQLVNLGSGRFCIARFFKTSIGTYKGVYGGDDPIYRRFVVFTGVEVAPPPRVVGIDGGGSYSYDDNSANDSDRNEKVKLRLIKHKSRRTSRTRSHVTQDVL